MGIRVKRVQEPAAQDDGLRVFVDRYWPRDVATEQAELHTWLRDVAPTPEAIAGWAHKPERWEDFKRRYRAELTRPNLNTAISDLRGHAFDGTLTLVHGSRSHSHNTALVLADFLGAPLEAVDTSPEPRNRRLNRVPSDMSWSFWLASAVALMSPLLSLLLIELVLVYRLRALLVLAAGIGVFSTATGIRNLRRERGPMSPSTDHVLNQGEGESVWRSFGQFLLPMVATILVVIGILGFVELLSFLARVLHMGG
jgi:uncharacterized protein YeaO (DUF488 family)